MEIHKLLGALCLLVPAISSAAKIDVPDFTGVYKCPAYKGKDNSWGEHTLVFEQAVLGGVPILLSRTEGLQEKTGPYDKEVVIIDGQWRYSPFFRNEKLYPMKIKNTVSDGRVQWAAEYPDYIDNAGKERKASTGAGEFWLNERGDLVSKASHYTGEYTCVRQKKRAKRSHK